ncbi:MAG: class II fructose-bisphosphate aldolase family protein [Bacilli bacterium]|nr:class II fructose-bisphosphate aldolase family protein [Bacilli bacterium]
MLVNGKEILIEAKRQNKAIFHFNINNLEWTKYILLECNKLNISVILGVSESAVNYMGGYNTVVNLVKGLIKDLDIKINVILHLDHGKSFESCKNAIDAGFTSVMIDGSLKELEENIRITKQVVEYAHMKEVTVEAELGAMGELKDDQVSFGKLTNVSDCLEFVNKTKIDSLAASVGTVHGKYTKELNIDYNLIKDIADSIDIPLVLHGGSGLSNDILKKCVLSGITKINVNSDLQDAWSKGVRKFLEENKSVIDPRKIILSGINNLTKEIDNKININN